MSGALRVEFPEFNNKYKRIGHLFQGRYKAILKEKESYVPELKSFMKDYESIF